MKNTLRWIAVLPGALLAATLACLFFSFINSFYDADWILRVVNLEAFGSYIGTAAKALICPFAVLFASIWIAPSAKRETAIFMIATILIGPIVLFGIVLLINSYAIKIENYLFLLFNTVGCFWSLQLLPDKIDTDKKALQPVRPVFNEKVSREIKTSGVISSQVIVESLEKNNKRENAKKDIKNLLKNVKITSESTRK